MITDAIFDLIKQYKPDFLPYNGEMTAAIAIIIRERNNQYEMMLIERSKQEGDPWSGQMAFPGGKIDEGDTDARAAAERETEEEVSVSLQSAEYVGRLDDLYGLKVKQMNTVLLSSFVYFIDRDIQPEANYEVANIVWVPLSYFTDKQRVSLVIHPRAEAMQLSGVRIDEANIDSPKINSPRVVWGLTFRVITLMFEVAGLKISVQPENIKMR